MIVRNIVLALLAAMSIVVLFIIPGPLFSYSSFGFYAISSISVISVMTFLFFYRQVLVNVFYERAKRIEEVTASSLTAWVDEAFPHMARIFTSLVPVTVGISAILNFLSCSMGESSIVSYISIGLLAIQGVPMATIVLITTYQKIFRKKKKRKVNRGLLLEDY